MRNIPMLLRRPKLFWKDNSGWSSVTEGLKSIFRRGTSSVPAVSNILRKKNRKGLKSRQESSRF